MMKRGDQVELIPGSGAFGAVVDISRSGHLITVELPNGELRSFRPDQLGRVLARSARRPTSTRSGRRALRRSTRQ